jgi:MFS family permease
MLSQVMRKRGRRPGMALGYGLAVVGGVISCVGVQLSFLPVFLAGLFLYGAGSATNLQARYAATDLAEPEHRSGAMGTILFASTFGSVFGPLLVQPAEHFGTVWFGLDRYAGPWLFSALFFAGAGLNVFFRLRPDPLLIWAAENGGVEEHARIRFTDCARAVLSSPVARLALSAMAVAQAVMVGVMAMTPIDMKMNGHEMVSPYVVSVHIAGMFAFSRLVGRYADKKGRLAALRAGGFVLMIACALSGVAADNVPMMFVAMWALGLGWTLALIGGSSLLIDNVPASYRVSVQGAADLTTAVCGGLAGVLCGFLLDWVGFAALAVGSAALTVPVLIGVLSQSRRDTAMTAVAAE